MHLSRLCERVTEALISLQFCAHQKLTIKSERISPLRATSTSKNHKWFGYTKLNWNWELVNDILCGKKKVWIFNDWLIQSREKNSWMNVIINHWTKLNDTIRLTLEKHFNKHQFGAALKEQTTAKKSKIWSHQVLLIYYSNENAFFLLATNLFFSSRHKAMRTHASQQ